MNIQSEQEVKEKFESLIGFLEMWNKGEKAPYYIPNLIEEMNNYINS